MTSKISKTNGLVLATLMLATLAATSGTAQATCVFNGPHCISGKYPDLAATDAWLDSALSQSDAGNAGANPDNLPIPDIKTPPKGPVGKIGQTYSTGKIR